MIPEQTFIVDKKGINLRELMAEKIATGKDQLNGTCQYMCGAYFEGHNGAVYHCLRTTVILDGDSLHITGQTIEDVNDAQGELERMLGLPLMILVEGKYLTR